MISIDTEDTGSDFRHGSRPYLVTTCDSDGNQEYWEWSVDPLTREVAVDKDDVEQIRNIVATVANWGSESYAEEIRERHTIVLQNAKFDVTALGFIDPWFKENWPWNQTRDTLIAGHLLGSGYPHNLTDMVLQYLSIDIEPFEKKVEEATNKARRLARRMFPDWAIAKQGRPDMPSAKEKCWKLDMWLPRAFVKAIGYDGVSEELGDSEHHWDTITADYANADSFSTVKLWPVMKKLIHERDLWEIFQSRMPLIPIALEMEHRGITLSKSRMDALRKEYVTQADTAEKVCLNLAAGYKDSNGQPFDLTLPKSGNNKKLIEFVFTSPNGLNLKPVKTSDTTGVPSLDKEVMDEYLTTLPHRSPGLLFLQRLSEKRKRDTALSYLEGYHKFWIKRENTEDTYTLHPNLNITGTAHLRWSSNNPNSQNCSKQKGFNLRQMFGPAEGREWWSLDAQNIELRIPTFEAQEPALMDVYLRPKDPPYYGSYHLVIFDTLHPKLFKEHGKAVKDIFESTWYQWVKNGNFAVIYGCQEAKADATYHVKGAFKLIRDRFPKIAQLADRQIAIANRTGGIETIPDKSVNPRRGYPIMCARGNFGKVKPTLPLNYHVSGTAMQWMNRGMVRLEEQLIKWRNEWFDGFIAMQVHDEVVLDFPKADNPVNSPNTSNLPRIRVIQKLMEKGGEDINVPTPVSVEYNEYTWDKGVTI